MALILLKKMNLKQKFNIKTEGLVLKMLDTISLGKREITRLIVGGNPFSGNSHVNKELDLEMINYFSVENIKKTLFRCEECGINTMQVRSDKHIIRMLIEYRNDGGRMEWVAQTASELGNYQNHVRQIVYENPAGIYHHGTTTDRLFKEGKYEELKERLGVIRKTGCPVGLGTHMPAVIDYAEEHGWDIDFYMACVYNLSKESRESSAITGIANTGERFDEEDPPVMYKTIRRTSKPCLAFKILGASRKCATQESVKAAFDVAYASIKPSDAVAVGMYPKNLDQVALNAGYASQAMGKKAF